MVSLTSRGFRPPLMGDAFISVVSWTLLLFLFNPLLGFAKSSDKSAADYYVHSLPGAPEGPQLKMHAG